LALLLTAPFQPFPLTLSWRRAQAQQEVTVSPFPGAFGGRSRGGSSWQAHLLALACAAVGGKAHLTPTILWLQACEQDNSLWFEAEDRRCMNIYM